MITQINIINRNKIKFVFKFTGIIVVVCFFKW